MIASCAKDAAPKIYLDEHEYLSDILIVLKEDIRK